MTFIGLNPSSADETQDDPTVRRCVRFARDWGYARLQLLNLYAYRAADPKAMFAAVDPIGPENDRVLTLAIGFSDLIVCAWGASADPGRAADVLRLCAHPRCLGVTKQGAPRHPLYSRADTKPVAFLPP